MSFEISFDSKQPKLEPKLVSALYETKHLFWLFRFYTEKESFDVLIEPKQTEDQLNQFDREHGLLFFTENLGFFQSFSFFSFFPFYSVCYWGQYGCREASRWIETIVFTWGRTSGIIQLKGVVYYILNIILI